MFCCNFKPYGKSQLSSKSDCLDPCALIFSVTDPASLHPCVSRFVNNRVFGNVVFDYAPREGTWRGKWTTAMSGRNLGLLDTAINTGLTPDSLVRLMTEWRERALRP